LTFASDKKKTSLKLLNFIPSYGHFSKGQWRKGISDLWNVFMAIWCIAEPNETINRWQEDIDYRLNPDSYEYKIKLKNIKVYRELQYWMGGMILLNYINSILDIKQSDDDISFLGLYLATHCFNYDTYILTDAGPFPYSGREFGYHFGFIFGYRHIFEYYAKMIFPRPGVRYFHWYSDYVIPIGRKNTETYLGIGFSAADYIDNLDWDKVDKVVNRGARFYPRIGIGYILHQHQIKLIIFPYYIFSGTRAYDTDTYKNNFYKEERMFRGKIGENFGFQFVYRFNAAKHLYFELLYEFSKIREPEVENYQKEQNLYFHNFDFSLNYEF